VEKQAEIASRNGIQTSEQVLESPPTIRGVGDGVNECKHEVILPIATARSPDKVADLNWYETLIVEAPGDELPLVLGLKSMADKNGVLNMSRDSPTLTLPGPEGFEVKWSLGTRHFPLIHAPSGHLILPCDLFDKIPEKTGIRELSEASPPAGQDIAEHTRVTSSQVEDSPEMVTAVNVAEGGDVLPPRPSPP